MIQEKAGLSAGGAVIAAILASACCIGPVVLAFLGIGGTVSALVLAPYRPYLMALAFVLLGGAFAFAYRRPRPACCADGRSPGASSSRRTLSLLWLATLAVALLVGWSLLSGGASRSPQARTVGAAAEERPVGQSVSRTTILAIRGMTCGGCVARVEERLAGVRGVVGYEVSLQDNEARVSYDPAATTPEVIAAAVAETGFGTSLKSRAGRE
jgi:mercuric ion transport protein